jgi:hypothetical protein
MMSASVVVAQVVAQTCSGVYPVSCPAPTWLALPWAMQLLSKDSYKSHDLDLSLE